jgi:hypothetical protein
MCACSISISISVHQYTHNLFVVQDRLYCHSYIGGQVAAVSPIATTPTPLLPEWSRTQTWKAFSPQLPDDLLGEALHVLVQVVVDAAALPASSHRRLRTLLEQRLCTCCPASSRFLAASRTRRRALLLVPVLQERRE